MAHPGILTISVNIWTQYQGDMDDSHTWNSTSLTVLNTRWFTKSNPLLR